MQITCCTGCTSCTCCGCLYMKMLSQFCRYAQFFWTLVRGVCLLYCCTLLCTYREQTVRRKHRTGCWFWYTPINTVPFVLVGVLLCKRMGVLPYLMFVRRIGFKRFVKALGRFAGSGATLLQPYLPALWLLFRGCAYLVLPVTCPAGLCAAPLPLLNAGCCPNLFALGDW